MSPNLKFGRGFPPDLKDLITGKSGFSNPRNFATVWGWLLKFRVRSGWAKAVCFRSVLLFLKTLRRPKQSCPVEGFVTTSLSTHPPDGTIPGDSSNFTDTQPAAHPKSDPEYISDIISTCRSARDSHGSRNDRSVCAAGRCQVTGTTASKGRDTEGLGKTVPGRH